MRPEVPEELAALIARMMAKKPGQRFQEPAEVAQALAPFFKSRSVTVRGATWNSDSGGQPETEQATPSPISGPSPPAAEKPSSPDLAADFGAKQAGPALARESAIDLKLNFDDQRQSFPVAATSTGKRTPPQECSRRNRSVRPLIARGALRHWEARPPR